MENVKNVEELKDDHVVAYYNGSSKYKPTQSFQVKQYVFKLLLIVPAGGKESFERDDDFKRYNVIEEDYVGWTVFFLLKKMSATPWLQAFVSLTVLQMPRSKRLQLCKREKLTRMQVVTVLDLGTPIPNLFVSKT